jgi:ABC-type lipoprotein export system ATPase subunit
VIGPQSSGKSLLLNILFGTQFLSSAGRCTRGVYGSILELKETPGLRYKKILLLDTEGI